MMGLSRRASLSSLVAVLGGQSEVYQSHLCPHLGSDEPSSNLADIDCVAAISIHQALVDVKWLYFFCIEKLDNTSLFLTDINYDRNCFVELFLKAKFYRQFKIITALLPKATKR